MQVARVPWHVTAQYRLPVEIWRAAAGDGGLVRLSGDTFAELRELRVRAGAALERRGGGGPAGGRARTEAT